MLEIGKTYRNGRGEQVRIVAEDRKTSLGFTHVGLVDSGSMEQADYFRADGFSAKGDMRSNIVMPRKYVDVENALCLIRVRAREAIDGLQKGAWGAAAIENLIRNIDGDLTTMPSKELDL